MEPTKAAEVRRILDRYLVEIVEEYDLCPWARTARTSGELAIGIVWGVPTIDEWVASARALLAQPRMRVAMIVAPELRGPPSVIREVRDQLIPLAPSAGIAHFHPEANLDLASPARLVPFVRRSPDPLLQLVPLALLADIRESQVVADLALQAQILGGTAAPPREDVAEIIARANHATVTARHASLVAVLDDIAADRRAAYARVGISTDR